MSNENIELTNALLNAQWDQIEDLPNYSDLPTGSFQVRVTKAEVKEPRPDDENPDISVRVHVEVTAILEYNGDEEKRPKDGSLAMFTFKGGKGIQRFKQTFGGVGTEIGANTPAELIDRLEGLELGITVQSSHNKDNPDRPYSNLRTVAMA